MINIKELKDKIIINYSAEYEKSIFEGFKYYTDDEFRQFEEMIQQLYDDAGYQKQVFNEYVFISGRLTTFVSYYNAYKLLKDNKILDI